MLMCDEIQVDRNGTITYNPEIHYNQDKPLTEEEKEYLCTYYKVDGKKSMSYALARTESVVYKRYAELEKQGLVEYYKQKHLQRFI